jgi:hypothetical protein
LYKYTTEKYPSPACALKHVIDRQGFLIELVINEYLGSERHRPGKDMMKYGKKIMLDAGLLGSYEGVALQPSRSSFCILRMEAFS